MAKSLKSKELPSNLIWLADAPLFIDTNQVYRFYDAVVKPDSNTGTTTLEITSEKARELSGKLNLEASLSPSDFLTSIATFLPFLKAEVKGGVEGEIKSENTTASTRSIELHTITTPQRQLVQLTLHYLVNYQDRLFFVNKPSETHWRDATSISRTPRELVFLNLPGREEARRLNLPETKLIPTAAEFSDGQIELLFRELMPEPDAMKPVYPDHETNPEVRAKEIKNYWNWFASNFSVQQAVTVIEKAASNHGRIRWIDFQVPITQQGHTLHLHICPAGEYDTGVFAFNFVRRGYEHGLRLVGTLKSEPDMNVLAIYDK